MTGNHPGDSPTCPSATGRPTSFEKACPLRPDQAHRCAKPPTRHFDHTCTCGFVWNIRPEAPARGFTLPRENDESRA